MAREGPIDRHPNPLIVTYRGRARHGLHRRSATCGRNRFDLAAGVAGCGVEGWWATHCLIVRNVGYGLMGSATALAQTSDQVVHDRTSCQHV